MNPLPKVLLVEDDRSIAGALAQALKSEYDIDVASNGKTALDKAGTELYDLIILDLNLPDFHGLTICQQLRQRGLAASILILSGETKVLTKISLLDSGANDYLTKPFSLGELKARLRALQRVSSSSTESSELIVGDLSLNRHSYRVERAGVPINLRRKEFALLECLMGKAGSVVSRESLNHYVWQGSTEFWTNTVDVHIKNLRDKVDRPFGQFLIKTVHGRGYKIHYETAEVAKQEMVTEV